MTVRMTEDEILRRAEEIRARRDRAARAREIMHSQEVEIRAMADTCEICVFSRLGRRTQDSDAHLFCRRYPPAAKGGFPKVRPEYWCGEHKEATDA